MLADQILAKVEKAEEFLQMAEFAIDLSAWDAACSLLCTAAIHASDALIMSAGAVMQGRAEHNAAVAVLGRTVGKDAGSQLAFVLRYKAKSQYEARRCSRVEAAECLKRVTRLVERAR